MYVFDGATGNLQRKIDPPPSSDEAVLFGFQDAAPLSPGDVNGDNSADIYGNGFDQDGPTGAAEGRGWVFNGKTGTLLYSVSDPTPEEGGQFGWSMSKTDYNRDGRPDLYVGQSPHHIPDLGSGRGNGGTYVFDGRDGSLLKRLEMPASDRQIGSGFGPNLGWSQAAPGDLNADGEPDYVAGAPFFDASSPVRVNEGLVYVFLSRASCAGKQATKMGTTGNDVIIGTPGPDVIAGLGGDDRIDGRGGNDRICSGSGKDTAGGGTGYDVVFGEQGNDDLFGGAGRDYLGGGDGDDVLRGNADHDSLYGQRGNDVLQGGIGSDLCRGGPGRNTQSGCER
jgi:Ca2+-binding RTX toxin-like protein